MAFDDLTNIEQRLLNRQLDPPPSLRTSTLAAVARELAHPAMPAPATSIWSFLAAAAAIAIIALNLAHMSAMLTDFAPRPETDPRQTLALAASIQQALPDLPPQETQRMALAMSAGERLVPMPLVHGSSGMMTSRTNPALQEQ